MFVGHGVGFCGSAFSDADHDWCDGSIGNPIEMPKNSGLRLRLCSAEMSIERESTRQQPCLELTVLVADLLLKALAQGQHCWLIGVLRQNDEVFGVGVWLEVLIYLPGQWLS